MTRLILSLWLGLLPTALIAESIVLGLSRDQVRITTQFDGSDILIFGAVKREAPIPKNTELDVIITVAGPSEPLTVRRKSRQFGIWVNSEAVEVDAAPSFYAVAASGKLEDVIKDIEDLRYKISVERAIRSVGAPMTIRNAQVFSDAVIRIRQRENLYQQLDNQVAVDQQTLFRTAIRMPANLTEGDYATRIFLARGGTIISQYETTIDVRKVGLERWLFSLSRTQPLLYGLMSLAIAIAAGWGASAAFRWVRIR